MNLDYKYSSLPMVAQSSFMEQQQDMNSSYTSPVFPSQPLSQNTFKAEAAQSRINLINGTITKCTATYPEDLDGQTYSAISAYMRDAHSAAGELGNAVAEVEYHRSLGVIGILQSVDALLSMAESRAWTKGVNASFKSIGMLQDTRTSINLLQRLLNHRGVLSYARSRYSKSAGSACAPCVKTRGSCDYDPSDGYTICTSCIFNQKSCVPAVVRAKTDKVINTGAESTRQPKKHKTCGSCKARKVKCDRDPLQGVTCCSQCSKLSIACVDPTATSKLAEVINAAKQADVGVPQYVASSAGGEVYDIPGQIVEQAGSATGVERSWGSGQVFTDPQAMSGPWRGY